MYFLTPPPPPRCKILEEGWEKYLSELFQFKLGPNLLYTFAASPLRQLGQGLSNG